MCVYLFFPKTIFRLEMWLWKENHSTFHRLLDDCATGKDTAMNYILISATSIEVKVSLVIRPETELRIFTSLQDVAFIN